MIGGSGSGTDFFGRINALTGVGAGRVRGPTRWVIARALPGHAPGAAAVVMKATAARNPGVSEPVYSVTIDFDVNDTPTDAQLGGVAVQTLTDLQLEEHQALIIARRAPTPDGRGSPFGRGFDRLDVVVNRVHPVTFRPWAVRKDWPELRQSLKAQAQEFGWHRSIARPTVDEAAAAAWRTRGDGPERARFVGALRTVLLPHVGSVASWLELETLLAAHGWRSAWVPGILLLTDGIEQIAAARLGADFGLRALERRFAAWYPWSGQRTAILTPPVSRRG